MTTEIIKTVISSVISKAIDLIFEDRNKVEKAKLEHFVKMEQEKKELFQVRPELEIVEYKNYLKRTKYGLKKKCDIELFVAHIEDYEINGTGKNGKVHFNYRKADFNPDERCCVIYTLKNVGKTDIASLDVVCNLSKDTVFFPTTNRDKDYLYDFAGGRVINYSVCSDRKIRVGETITIKFCYHKDRIITGSIGAVASLGITDVNGNCWTQSFYAPFDYVEYSHYISYDDLKDMIRTDTAIECFKNPMLW